MEHSKLVRAESAAETQRVDIYAFIHKALRAFMCDTLTALGSTDADDAHEVATAIAQVRELAAFCAGHFKHENDFVHAAMEARRPALHESGMIGIDQGCRFIRHGEGLAGELVSNDTC